MTLQVILLCVPAETIIFILVADGHCRVERAGSRSAFET
jgi:hypothetical protein